MRYAIGMAGTDALLPAGTPLEADTLDDAHDKASAVRAAIDEDYIEHPVDQNDKPRQRAGMVSISYTDGTLIQQWRALGGEVWVPS